MLAAAFPSFLLAPSFGLLQSGDAHIFGFAIDTPWLKAGLAIGLSVVFILAINFITLMSKRALKSRFAHHETSAESETTLRFLVEVLRAFLISGAILIILAILGMNVTSLAAVFGAATLAIGLSLQGTLANVAAGVIIVVLKLYRVGDNVEIAGKAGNVKRVQLFHTELESLGGQQIMVPNGEAVKSPITNISRYEKRRVEALIPVNPDVDFDGLSAHILSQLGAIENILPDPAPICIVSKMDVERYWIALRVWAKAEHAARLGVILPTQSWRWTQSHMRSLASKAEINANAKAVKRNSP